MATTAANKAICISGRICKSIIGLWDQRGGGGWTEQCNASKVGHYCMQRRLSTTCRA